MNLIRSAVLLIAAATSIGASKPSPKLGPVAPANWTATVVRTPSEAHLLGNPAAKVKLIEYVSYTCSHCADFEIQAGSELALGFIKPGTGSLEFRPYFRNPIDIAATLMAYCGPPSRFMGNHAALLRGQKGWLTPVTNAQMRRWQSGTFASQMQAVASDLKLYDLFIKRGYNRIELERCLTNEPLARRIASENRTAESVIGIQGTPSFVLNDRLLDAGDWRSLRPYLAAATR